jgi:hypothetical protein
MPGPPPVPPVIAGTAFPSRGSQESEVLAPLHAEMTSETPSALQPAAVRGTPPVRGAAASPVARTSSVRPPRVEERVSPAPPETSLKAASVELHIGAVTIEVHEPSPPPAPLPATPRPEARPERDAAFSLSRHYLRGD